MSKALSVEKQIGQKKEEKKEEKKCENEKKDGNVERNFSEARLQEFLKKHIKATTWRNERTLVYDPKDLIDLAKDCTNVFKNDKSLIRVNPPCTVVGDIHGQYRDLVRILFLHNEVEQYEVKKKNEKTGEVKTENCKKIKSVGFMTTRFVFLGDYVGSGNHSLECISLVFALKLLLPQQYSLLRGNHETRGINCEYGFKAELHLRFIESVAEDIWKVFNDAFDMMPVAALIGEKILCMHGGISPHLKSLKDIEQIERPVSDLTKNPLVQDLLWSDPIDENSNKDKRNTPFIFNPVRGLSVLFNREALDKCLADLNISMIIRAHQVQPNGYKCHYAQHKIVTIFSAPRYAGEQNLGAFVSIDRDGTLKFHQMKTLNYKVGATANTGEERLSKIDAVRDKSAGNGA